jgi:hypothetical protein
MKMLFRTTAVMGAAGLVAAGLAAATPANAVDEDIFQIKVTEVTTDFDSDFDEPDEAEVGDDFSFTSNLRQDGDRVGKDAGECEVKDIDGDDLIIRCVIRYHFFDRGTIRAAGKFRVDVDDVEDWDFSFKLPVRSGTGDYDDAGGSVTNRQVSEEKARLTFRLTNVDH